MPRRLRNLSGDQVIAILEKFGFALSFSKGSHCKLSRLSVSEKQVLVVPRHASLAKGTLKAIYRKSISYIGEDELKDFFYTE